MFLVLGRLVHCDALSGGFMRYSLSHYAAFFTTEKSAWPNDCAFVSIAINEFEVLDYQNQYSRMWCTSSASRRYPFSLSFTKGRCSMAILNMSSAFSLRQTFIQRTTIFQQEQVRLTNTHATVTLSHNCCLLQSMVRQINRKSDSRRDSTAMFCILTPVSHKKKLVSAFRFFDIPRNHHWA